PLYDSNDNVEGIIYYGSDVTNRVLAKHSQENATKRLKEIINSLPQLAWTEKTDGSVDFLNKIWFDYTAAKEKLNVKNWDKIIHPSDFDSFLNLRKQKLSLQEPYKQELRLFRDYDQSFRWHYIYVVPIKNINNEEDFWVGTAVDIDAQKQAEFKKDEFLNISSHELKTPLTSIQGYYQLLKESFPDDIESSKFYLSKFERSINRINRLINELLSVSRIETGNFVISKRDEDINDLVSDAISNYTQDRNRIEIIGNAKDKVSIDYDRMLQVLENLISNAVKFSPANTPIKIDISENKQYLSINVIDEGIGISKEEQQELFDRYYRVKHSSNVEGMGLGLYISKKIVVFHKGQLTVKSKKNVGTTFTIKIPK
ncbi:MAG: PAS domain-containing sensor histidine kinase, partial [Cyclobacteriaceae bacterium]